MKSSKKVTRNKKSSANRSSVGGIKVGQKVTYNGKRFTDEEWDYFTALWNKRATMVTRRLERLN